MPTKKFYTPLSKALHWIIALIVLPMITGSFFIEDINKAYKGTIIMTHKSFGLVILVLMIIRLLHILRKGRPPLPSSVAWWERKVSRWVQYSLYLSLILMPLSGWMMSTAANHAPSFFTFGTFPFPGIPHNEVLSNWLFDIHHYLAFIILALLFLHISGALKHHFIDKDEVLANMLGAKK